MGLLEETLSDVSHDSLVLSDFGWNAYQCAKLWRQINVLSFLSNFKKRLTNGIYFNSVSCQEVVNHVGSGFLIAVVKNVIPWVHVPLDLVHLVGSMGSIFCHNNGTLKFAIYEILIVALKPIIN